MREASEVGPGAYDHLIDAEREALSGAGRRLDKVALIRALREASGLGPKEARLAVEGYLARRGGKIPPGPTAEPGAGWIDDLLDAERRAAAQEDRPLTKALLIRAVRGASGLGPKEDKCAVEDYLRRKGGAGLPVGSEGWRALAVVLGLVGLAAAAAANWLR